MKNQRRTKAPYTVESIERALAHHKSRGSVDEYLRPIVGRTWVVTVRGQGPVELSNREAYALCVGLAAADRAAQDRVLREIGKDMGPSLLRWSEPTRLRQIAAGGGPIAVFDDIFVYCPLCHCSKSGLRSVPNQIGEACANSACICHDDDWNT